MTAEPTRAVLLTILPGPDRKRSETMYQYRVTYRQPEADADGCLMLWHVSGGRQEYQIALERDDRQRLRWHCTCADAVYRGEKVQHHVCKHVRGLLAITPPLPGQPALRKSA